jgi:hypothetical protein
MALDVLRRRHSSETVKLRFTLNFPISITEKK